VTNLKIYELCSVIVQATQTLNNTALKTELIKAKLLNVGKPQPVTR